MYVYLIYSAFMDETEEPVGFYSSNDLAYKNLKSMVSFDQKYVVTEDIPDIPTIQDFNNKSECITYGNWYSIVKQELDNPLVFE